jgi:hypothetical protein
VAAGVHAPPTEAEPDVDEDLYGGFVGNEDRRTLQRLRELSPEKLATRQPAFEDGRLDELLFRYRARNFPDSADATRSSVRWQQHCAARLHDGAGGAQTLVQYFQRIDDLAESADDRQQEILSSMFSWREVRPGFQGTVVAPDERLPWPQTAVMGAQHVVAMFGATVLAPILMGFEPNVAILMSGIGT